MKNIFIFHLKDLHVLRGYQVTTDPLMKFIAIYLQTVFTTSRRVQRALRFENDFALKSFHFW